MKLCLNFLFLLYIGCPSLRAQFHEIQFKRLSINEGLSSPIVLSIVKDTKGFLWFGTSNGLNKYDGYQIRTFENDSRDSTSISDNWINAICVSRNGDLWIGTQNGGLNRFDYTSEKFTSYMNNPNDSTSIPDNRIVSLCEDSDGTLWIGTFSYGLCWKKSDENKIYNFKSNSFIPMGLKKSTISSIIEDKNKNIWVGTSFGLCRITKEKNQQFMCRIYERDKFHPYSSSFKNAVRALYKNEQGILYVIMINGELYTYNRESDEFYLFKLEGKSKRLSNVVISSIVQDRFGKFWLGTANDGVLIADIKNKIINKYVYEIGNSNSLNSNTVFCISEDDAGGIWLGTYQGVANYDYRRKRFINYLHQKSNPHCLSEGYVLDISEDPKGGIWVATHGGGLNYLPYGASEFMHFRHNPHDPTSISSDMLICMTDIRDNTLWIGSRDGGLIKFNIRTKKAKNYLHKDDDPYSLSDNAIFYLFQDKKGNVWVGTARGGLDKFDPKTEKFIHYKNNPDDSTSLSENSIWAIQEDRKGNIWVGTQKSGLNRLDPKTGKCTRYLHNPNDPKSIRSNSIYALHEDSKGRIWIGTVGGGLNCYNENTNDFTSYTDQDGLCDNHIGTIMSDLKGRLWIVSRCLTMFDPETKSFRNFSREDGILCGEFNQESGCVGRDGKMYFGGVEGYVVFNPDNLQDNNYCPPVVFTGFKVFDESRHLPSDYSSGIYLSYEENYFSFEFAALSYTAPEKNMYRYMLEGYDKDWVNSGTKRYAMYNKVEPGDYVFKVQGSNNDGVWNTKGASIAIHIVPPFWKTSWFRFSMLFAFMFIITYTVWLRINYLKRRTRQQQELSKKLIESQEEERKRIGAGLHDSLGQDLLVIKNLAIMGIEANEKKKSSDEQLQKISTLVSQVLAEVREISYNLRPYHLDQLGLTGALRSIISRVSSSSKIVFKEDLDDLNNLFPPEQEINIFRIVQEAVNNIIKHSKATKADIFIKRDKNYVKFILSDNGIGFDSNHKGFGLTGMAERVRILDGTMEIRSEPNSGTRITISIPLGRKHER